MPVEAKARIRINDLLSKSGWRFFADANGPANVHLEAHVKLTKKILDELGNDFEKTSHGYVDYLLVDEKSFPIAVLEAKSEKFEPLVGKEQARKEELVANPRSSPEILNNTPGIICWTNVWAVMSDWVSMPKVSRR